MSSETLKGDYPLHPKDLTLETLAYIVEQAKKAAGVGQPDKPRRVKESDLELTLKELQETHTSKIPLTPPDESGNLPYLFLRYTPPQPNEPNNKPIGDKPASHSKGTLHMHISLKSEDYVRHNKVNLDFYKEIGAYLRRKI